MKNKFLQIALLALAALSFLGCQPKSNRDISLVLTRLDETKLLEKSPLDNIKAGDDAPVLSVNSGTEYQTMDGFGYTLTGGSAMHIHRMNAEPRKALLTELFGKGENDIAVSYLRLSVGASDLDEKPFSYAEIPDGETDPELESFTLDYDQKHLIPVLKEILAINPDIKLMGSPWSPPKWMKDNNDTRGGSLLPEFYGTYANYLVNYIEGMKAEGIRIEALTVQNEPLHPGNNPSLLMLPEDQAVFVRDHLGPAFEKAGIDTKIIIYDHNADRPDYPITILNDPEARKYIDGSAFHLYGGEIEALSEVHEAHPDKNLYFTEQWIGAPGNFPGDMAWHTKELIIGATRNWAKTVLEWNLAADPNQEPHTDRGGCDRCLGAVTIDGDEIVKNPAYYIIGQASKFVVPGSVRIESNVLENLPNVAFKTPEGNIVIIAINENQVDLTFKLNIDGEMVSAHLPTESVGTFIWTPGID